VSNADLIAYLERRRRARIRAGFYALGAVAVLLLAVLAVTAILHAAGVGSHTQTTLDITGQHYHVIRTQVGAIPILP
jgi:hypothetical protein